VNGLAPIIVWFRQDLRLADNPALAAAARSGCPLIPLYILDDSGEWPLGGASRWWLHHSLASLKHDLAQRGAPLVLRRGDSAVELRKLIAETGAQAVYWNRIYEPHAVARDTALKTGLGIPVHTFNASLLREPWDVKSGAGTHFKVFTPFYRALKRDLTHTDNCAAPERLAGVATPIASGDIGAWALTPMKPNWAAEFPAHWTPGEAGALARLDAFLNGALKGYANSRDVPGIPATSRLSPHLQFGEISPWRVWSAAESAIAVTDLDREKFQAELAWREFSHHLLFHEPRLPVDNLRKEFDAFPWTSNSEIAFRAWTRGQTGVPIVDAGMRELWATGWMHNRVRMIAASFLVKNLMIDWRLGARWFWDTLADASLANNSASWQWVAGSGADAAPFFRIFNPVIQGQKFDAAGDYVRRWVPEIARLPHANVHAPWDAGASIRAAAGVDLGVTYPQPIVDLAASRNRALQAFTALRPAA
jgi:deoxyribodipyrimidine photo-lyase